MKASRFLKQTILDPLLLHMGSENLIRKEILDFSKPYSIKNNNELLGTQILAELQEQGFQSFP